MPIETFVFIDLETTSLPWLEKNQTKIVEFSAVAASRLGIANTAFGHTPPVSKLTFVVNPTRPISPVVTRMTGFTNKSLVHAPLFKEKVGTIKAFLGELPKPVCLVAHNGNVFDFRILVAEFIDANAHLPSDLLVVDSLVGFRKLLKATNINYEYLKGLHSPTSEEDLLTSTEEDLLTDDEDEEWPDLVISEVDLNDIDDLCYSDESIGENKKVSLKKEMSIDIIDEKRTEAIQNIFKNNKSKQDLKESFTLSALYKRLLNKEEDNAHRAEVDCLMLAQCVVALKDEFIPWADEASKPLTEIKPLVRYR